VGKAIRHRCKKCSISHTKSTKIG